MFPALDWLKGSGFASLWCAWAALSSALFNLFLRAHHATESGHKDEAFRQWSLAALMKAFSGPKSFHE